MALVINPKAKRITVADVQRALRVRRFDLREIAKVFSVPPEMLLSEERSDSGVARMPHQVGGGPIPGPTP